MRTSIRIIALSRKVGCEAEDKVLLCTERSRARGPPNIAQLMVHATFVRHRTSRTAAHHLAAERERFIAGQWQLLQAIAPMMGANGRLADASE